MLRVSHFGLTNIGRIRANNEDAWFANARHGLYVLADGLGGQNSGEVAARIVTQVLPEMLKEQLQSLLPTDSQTIGGQIKEAMKTLSTRIHLQAAGRADLVGMGATAVLCVIHGRQAWIGHLGDSRAYLFRDNQLLQLTEDHSIVQLLCQAGELTPEQAALHPARSRLTRCMGMPGEPIPDCQVLNLEPGDRLMLCSDGLSGMLTEEHIARIFRQRLGRKETCGRLIRAANKAGGKDNITVIVISASRR